MSRTFPLFLVACVLLGQACETPAQDTGELPVDPSTGKPLLEVIEGEGEALKDDSFNGLSGPRVSGISSSTEVWRVTRRWYHITGEAGLAWGADSGLTWDEKYAAWVDSMVKVGAGDGSTTFQLTTPFAGKTLPAPALECAETAMFLRATFASWHGLPFFMAAWHSKHGRMYFGHFGIVTRDGVRVKGYPRFKSAYEDHTASLGDHDFGAEPAAWPSDTALAGRSLTSLKDDENPFLGEGAYAGAYFDAIFLNKRVGHLLMRLLTNFGSMHLADSRRNMFNLAPAGIRAGDVMLQRWQRRGIGHTLVIKTVRSPSEESAAWTIESVFGSMPRIQPHWYGTALTTPYLTSNSSGGEGSNSDGEVYASMGGGLKRWRTSVTKSGRWYNIVPTRDREHWVDATNVEQLAARAGVLKEMVGKLTPVEQREAIEQRIAIARENLRRRPASCTNRMRREKAFSELYALNSAYFDLDQEATDRAHRALEDYVFAELVYDQSRTCCWNSTTEAMAEIVLQYNEAHVWDHETKTCNEPVVFMARAGDYTLFADYAESIGRGAEWVAWSADETCPHAEAGGADDTPVEAQATPACAIADALIEGAASADAPSAPPQDGDPCGEVTWEGLCHGSTVVWCQNGEVATYSCSATHRQCGFDEDSDYYWCLDD